MEHKLSAVKRNDFGKGSARQLRRAGRVPAVVYGHGADPLHFSVDAHEMFLAIKGQANAIITIELEGESILALVKDIQRHPLSRQLVHADLLRVKRGEKVEVEVPVELVGESAPGTMATLEMLHLLVKAPATNLPDVIKVDVQGREDGAHVSVADIPFPADVECEIDPEAVVVVVSTEDVEEEPEETPATAQAVEADTSAE